MTNLTKTLLTIALAGFAVGFGTDWLWGLGKPIGAICLGLFLVSKVLEKEFALPTEHNTAQSHSDAHH